jgi:hypothetical protein
MSGPTRRGFLKSASLLAVGASSAIACDAETRASLREKDPGLAPRPTGFDRARLDALAAAVLPESLGTNGRQQAVEAFVGWVDGYDPAAEEMHGYGYADVRYLPADPAPAWRAQLDALDVLSRRIHQAPFPSLDVEKARLLLHTVLRRERVGDRLPAPLGASHIAIALLSHWTSSPAAWDRALGVQVGTMTCRPLDDANRKPLPVVTAPA